MSPHAALGIVIIATLLVSTRPASASEPGQTPIHVYCGTGDHLWVREREPVDSPATIDAMFEWMAETYGVKRVYWRGGQSHLWDSHYKLGPESPQAYDWAMGWKHHLYNDLKINEAAVDSARRHEMEIFMYTGLFEHGVQPDVGIISPYLFEDQLRIDHPEWCVVDRWGERRCPGPIAFCYPEARRAVIDRYVRHVVDSGYDGINFYTYVENVGIRYLDEFGFNQPVLDEFNKRYPEVNLREDALTAEQKLYWHECRGKFVTDFLRELHEALAAEGKALSVIIDSKEPDYAQPWWGKEIPGTGLIHMDWETWVAEGIIDELWVQLGYVADQRAVLDRALGKAAGTDVKLTVRTPTPFDAGWDPYVEAGVTPIACITSPVSGIERVTLEPTSVAALTSPDWRMRVQALADITGGALEADAATVASLADDPHVLVRRRTMDALAALGAGEQVPVIERALTAESESSVRMAAAGALVHVNGPESPQRILAALEGDGHFQFKLACIEALAAMARRSLPAVTEGTQHPSQAVREVSVRALYKLG
ncbi:MAG TPA: HEAT repeat domain-containing protein, partial [Armatimonadota bacterium]|nr:HEAT repeat domain-containing protein [Armatimonadota bacterium]